MSSPAQSSAAPAMKPRDAATLIIVDGAPDAPRVLMGKRRMDQVFMPGKFVFPGGRVDKEDRLAASADELRPLERDKLLLEMKGGASAARARAIALAAIRETFEEVGFVIGAPGPAGPPSAVASWRDFFARGYLPKLSGLTYFARAITPPGRPRRYDTRFFCVPADVISARFDITDGELSGVDWVSIEAARELDLPPITRVILEDLQDRMKLGGLTDGTLPIPYYHHKNGSFRRELLCLVPG